MKIQSLLTSPIQLLEIIKEDEETYTYKFDIPEGCTWDAGTNAHLVATGSVKNFIPEKEFTRHFSICSLPDEGYMGFTTRIRNNASTFKENLKVSKIGDKLQLFGLQNRLPLVRKNQTVVLISMGVGIATMRPILLSAASHPRGLTKVINITIDKDDKEIYANELRSLSPELIEHHYTHSRDDFYNEIDKTLTTSQAEYHIVGSNEFVFEITRHLLNNKIAKTNIRLDKKPHRAKEILDLLSTDG